MKTPNITVNTFCPGRVVERERTESKARKTSKVVLGCFVTVFLLTGYSVALDNNSSPRSNDRASSSRTAKMLSPATARKLAAAQTAMVEGRIDESLAELKALIEKGDRISGFDMAKTYQILAYAYINKEDYKSAIQAAEKSLSFNELEIESGLELRYQLANLYLYQEDFDNCLSHLKIWFELVEVPTAEAYFMAAQTHALKEDYDSALDFGNKGINQHRRQHVASDEVAPKQNWYSLLLAIHLNLNLYAEAVPLLQEMLSYWPQNYQAFLQLSSIYQELQQDGLSLVALSLAQQNGLLEKSEHFNRLLQLYRIRDYPYKGAALFSDIINIDSEAGEIQSDAKRWEDLSSAWMQAREWGRAQTSLIEAANRSKDGKNWLLLCQTSVQDEQWQQSRQFCQRALDKGGLGLKAATAWQQIALSYYHEESLPSAMEAFGKCSSWSDTEEKQESSMAQESKVKKSKLQNECGSWYAFVESSIAEQKAEEKRLQDDRLQALKRREQRLKKINVYSR